MGYNDTPLRFSESSEGSVKEKGWNFLPLNNHSSEKFEVPILPSTYEAPSKPVDYLEGVRIEKFRLERHPFQVAEPLPQPPPPAKVANPVTYRDWDGPVLKIEPLPLAPPQPAAESLGLSPVEFKVGQKTKIVQAPGTKITQQELSLYPSVVTNAGLNTRPISGLSTSSPIGGRRKDWSPGHMAVSSVESTTPVSGRKERPPKHRPPPLDLSSVSNLNSSTNRRR
jgi:hypothetical protein